MALMVSPCSRTIFAALMPPSTLGKCVIAPISSSMAPSKCGANTCQNSAMAARTLSSIRCKASLASKPGIVSCAVMGWGSVIGAARTAAPIRYSMQLKRLLTVKWLPAAGCLRCRRRLGGATSWPLSVLGGQRLWRVEAKDLERHAGPYVDAADRILAFDGVVEPGLQRDRTEVVAEERT